MRSSDKRAPLRRTKHRCFGFLLGLESGRYSAGCGCSSTETHDTKTDVLWCLRRIIPSRSLSLVVRLLKLITFAQPKKEFSLTAQNLSECLRFFQRLTKTK